MPVRITPGIGVGVPRSAPLDCAVGPSVEDVEDKVEETTATNITVTNAAETNSNNFFFLSKLSPFFKAKLF